MKKHAIYFLFLVSFSSLQPLFAQLEKGTFVLGGSAGFNTSGEPGQTAKDIKGYSVNVSPDVFYFPVRHLAVGINLLLSYSRYNMLGLRNRSANQISQAYGIGPVLRYYFPIGKKWAVFPELSYTATTARSGYPYYDNYDPLLAGRHYHERGNVVQAGLGTSYFMTPNIGFEARLFHKKTRYKYESGGNSSMANFNFNIALQVYIHKQTS
jgi:hypothetical protein